MGRTLSILGHVDTEPQELQGVVVHLQPEDLLDVVVDVENVILALKVFLGHRHLVVLLAKHQVLVTDDLDVVAVDLESRRS